MSIHLSGSFVRSLRTFAYFMSSGTHHMLEGVVYLSLYGNEPSVIEQVFAIYTNVIELDTSGKVLNGKYAEQKATAYLRSYCDLNFKVTPAFEDWEVNLH